MAIMLIVSMTALFNIEFNPCNLYNRIFNRKLYKLWQFFINNAGKFEYSYTYKKYDILRCHNRWYKI